MGQVTSDSGRELIERMYELFNEGRIEEGLALVSPEIEWDWSRSLGPDHGVFHGRSGVERFMRKHLEMWETIEMLPEEILEAGEEFVVSVRVRLRGREGIEVEARGPHVVTIRDGLVVRYRLFQERGEALAAVGLA